MAAINTDLVTRAAWKLARRHGAELEEVESRLQFYYLNMLHRKPFNPERGGTEEEYNLIVITNCVHRVSRELARDAQRRARTVSLDELSAKAEEACDA